MDGIFSCLCLSLFLTYMFFCSYALFDNNGLQVPQELVTNVGEAFEKILKEACSLFRPIFQIYI